MGLIIKGFLVTYALSPSEGAVGIGLQVQKRYLSAPYALPGGSSLKGTILEIAKLGKVSEEDTKAIGQLTGKEVKFVVHTTWVGSDYLLLSAQSWSILRDYAILPDEWYQFKIRLEEAEVDGKTVKLYPVRDLVVE